MSLDQMSRSLFRRMIWAWLFLSPFLFISCDAFAVFTPEPKNWATQLTDVPKAGAIYRPERKIIVAIIDTGADISHPLLRESLWKNPGESGWDDLGHDKSKNGKDDDGNGYVDDLHGWNFVSQDKNLTDHHGHGTHIAGIVAQIASDPRGVQIMVLKFFDPTQPRTNPLRTTLAAIEYAVKMGAHIINYSAGGDRPSEAEREAIRKTFARNILFVAAAGNEKSNSDIRGYYPASYGYPNILSVAAVDSRSSLLPLSNFGANSVHIAAPGKEIFSSLPNFQYGAMSGTSQATAFVSGIAALLMSQNSEPMEASKISRHLIQSGNWENPLVGKTLSFTRINAYRALTLQDEGTTVSGLALAHENISANALLSLQKFLDKVETQQGKN